LAAARDTPTPGTSRYDRIYIVPTSRVTTSATVLPPPPSTATPVPLVVDDDDNAPPPGPGQRVVPPQTLPPGVRVPQQDANRLPPQGEEAPPRPAPTPSNPFGVAPGSSTPGVITPAPTPAGPPRER
ncbi:MAG TPA: hypothetical protein VFB85_26125, partial [Vicinamibacterales bacterium]|nr:hypothetical protein [Vicinamibacterales bacterium]